MRNNPIAFTFFLVIILILIDLYAFKGIRLALKNFEPDWIRKITFITYWIISSGIIAGILLLAFKPTAFFDFRNYFFSFNLFGLFILFLVPKLIFVIFHGMDDLLHLARLGANSLFPGSDIPSEGVKISRASFLTQTGLVISAIPFVTIAHGILRGRFNFRVIKKELYFDNLPQEFDGVKIAQISDIHIGSFLNYYSSVEKGIRMVNETQPDYIFFTGDLVNNFAGETEGWKKYFRELKAKKGKFSILGNHDYGDYVEWPSSAAKAENLEKVKKFHREIDFDLLLNENRILTSNGQSIALLGVENWGRKPFPQYGDINKALAGTENIPFRILLSHDPSHWDEQVLKKKPVDLTLSGHTHGMQFGVEVGNIKWSPVKMRYPRWGGLYREGMQYLYVNRGFGFIGFPGRIGMPPEITLLELKSGKGIS